MTRQEIDASTLREEYEALHALAAGNWYRTGDAGPAVPPQVRRVRDLTMIGLLGDVHLVIACDSNASIGEKPNDALKQPYAEQGISVLKVALMEVLASGAAPLVIVNALCMEMEPSGRKLIESMRNELIRCGFDPDIMLTGSTEDNVETTQSGAGITVIGVATEETLRLGRTVAGDTVLCVGTPKGGLDNPYTEHDDDIASIDTMLALTEVKEVHEILPVGSHGVLYEAEALATFVGRNFRLTDESLPIDLETSAGTSTAVLVSVEEEHASLLEAAVSAPIHRIGEIV